MLKGNDLKEKPQGNNLRERPNPSGARKKGLQEKVFREIISRISEGKASGINV